MRTEIGGALRERSSEVRKYTVTGARKQFKDVVNNVVYTRQPAIVTKHGGEAVAIVPYDLLEIIIRIEALNDLHKARKSLDDFDRNGGTSLEDLKKELGLE